MTEEYQQLLIGIDVGSTTTKAVAVREDGRILYSDYRRHNADQLKSVIYVLRSLSRRFPGARVRMALTGSGARGISEAARLPFIQEVVANSIVLKKKYPDVRTAIELGGQDAKIIFFHKDGATGKIQVSDMRMNGTWAGGTGAFIDEVGSIL